jgi:hypothetical protein
LEINTKRVIERSEKLASDFGRAAVICMVGAIGALFLLGEQSAFDAILLLGAGLCGVTWLYIKMRVAQLRYLTDDEDDNTSS